MRFCWVPVKLQPDSGIRLPVQVNYKTRAGWPHQISTELKRAISHYVNNADGFRIGITNWPERRAQQYEATGWVYDEMIVLYETRSHRNAVRLEKELIRHNWHRDTLEVDRDGGGGRRGEGWYFLYIVRRRT